MPILSSKVTPVQHELDQVPIKENINEPEVEDSVEMFVMSLHTLFKRYGGQRHPKIEPYEDFRDRGELWAFSECASCITRTREKRKRMSKLKDLENIQNLI